MSYGFEELRSKDCPDFRFKGREFVHKPTGAKLCWLENTDQNRTFAITFRTPPSDSKGTPHILEHSVLCGSRSYPLRDPFAVLLKSSLHTFLNAFTAHHYTSYPVASQNAVDFKNLVTVYLDATLHPLITEETYLRQAWHYEIEKALVSESSNGNSKQASKLALKGVVFNEMKGRYSDASGVLYRALLQNIFPDTLYKFDSGGDPDVIPNLSYDELKSFHSTYYHPSNAYVFAYGAIDTDELFSLLDKVFSEFKKQSVSFEIGVQSQFSKPRSTRVAYVPGRGESDGNYVVSGWKIPYDGSLRDELRLLLLERLLMGSQASTLYKVLTTSGLGDRLSGFGLIDVDTQAFFSTGLRGVKDKDEKNVRDLVFSTLESIKSFSKEEIEGVVNSFEFRMREQISNSPNRGIQLLSYVTTNWIHRDDPFFAFDLLTDLEAIREELSQGDKIFEPLIKKHFLENSHRVDVTLYPDEKLSSRKDQEEKEKLAKTEKSLTKAEIESIELKAAALDKHEPESDELLRKIPVLKRQDLRREIRKFPYEVFGIDDVKALSVDIDTSGILYAHLGFNLKAMNESLMPWLSFFSRCLVYAGTEKHDYAALTQRIQRDTGGISTFRGFDVPFEADGIVSPKEEFWYFLDGSVLASKQEKLFSLFQEIVHAPRFKDRERITQIYKEMRSGYEDALVSRPLGYAVRRARSTMNRTGIFEDMTEGYSQLIFLRSIEEMISDDFEGLSKKLFEIRDALFNSNNLFVQITAPRQTFNDAKGIVSEFISSLPKFGNTAANSAPRFDIEYRKECTLTKTRVSYVSLAVDMQKLGIYPSPSVEVVLNHVKDSYLWDEIRVKGGAYGASCAYDRERLMFTATSWDDPQPFRTVEVAQNIGKYLLEVSLSDDEVERNVIGTIGAFDQPASPMMQGLWARGHYLLNHPEHLRQMRRDKILATTVEDFRNVGEALLNSAQAMSVSIFGPESEQIEGREYNIVRTG